MTDIMAKDRVKRLIIQRMIDAGWKMPTGASEQFLFDEYISELRGFSEDELNAAWDHVRNHSEESERAWRYWPPPKAFKSAAVRRRQDSRPVDTGIKAFNQADATARKYAGDRINSDLQWAWKSKHLNEIREFLRAQAMEQALAGRDISVVIPDHRLDEWKASVIEVGEIYDVGRFKSTGQLIKKFTQEDAA